MLKKIYVVRHGFRSAWSVDHTTGEYTSTVRSPTGIAADPPLTSHGTRQADEMASHLATLPIDAVYSSPYYRCLQTINPYATLAAGGSATGATGGKIRAEPGIAEWFGSAPFDHPRPADTAVLADMFPLLDTGYTPSRVPSSKGETLAELYARVGQAAEAIVRRSEEEGHKTVVLCTHAAVVIVLGRVLTGQIPESADNADFEAYTCGLSTYERTGEEALGGWKCTLNSDCSFLTGGAERGWNFSGDESFPGTGSMSQEGEAKL